MSNNILYEEQEEEEEEEEAQSINQEEQEQEQEEENLEPTITNVNLNYDRDDSLNDVISFGKQTPFRFEYGSQLRDELEEEDDDEEEKKFNKKQKRYIDPNDAITNTSIDLIDERDFMSSSKQQHQPHSHLSSNEFMNALQNQQTFSNLSANDFILNLKDTTIDEIYLIPESIKKKFLSKSIDLREQEHHEQQIESTNNLTGLIDADTSAALNRHNLIYQTPPASSRHRLSHSSSRISAAPVKESNSPNNNNSIVYRSDSKLSTTSPSRIPIAAPSLFKSQSRPQSRLSFANYEPRAKLSSSSNQISKPAASASASTSTNLNNTNISKKWSKSTNLQHRPAFKQSEGAFKFYSNNYKEDLSNRNLRQPANPSVSTNNTKPTVPPPTAPSTVKSSSQDKSRSSPFVSIDKSKKTAATSEAKRTSAMNLNYSIESDESFMLEDLINNPAELKKKLKEGKMDKEQLGQLQQNYIHLLEQYAEKENFIDKFRLGYDWNNFPNSNNNIGINKNKNYNDMINRMSSSNLFSLASPSPKFTQNIDSIQSKLNASNDAIRLPDSAIDTYGSSNPPLSTLKSFTPNIDSTLNINNNNGQPNQGVFVITTTSSTSTALNRASSNLFTPELGQEQQQQSALDYNLVSENYSPNDLLPADENIVVEQNSKLGILLQTKILEDKMQSFVTLINEKQLNQLEKKQVFESIKTDYENLLKNYQEVKKTDLSGIMPNELDMDIDLNKELSKMKDLLTNIVDKMNTNQTEKSSSASVTSDEVKSSRGSSSASSYGNNNKEELMDQYNRLLDVFNSQSDTGKSKSLEKQQQQQQSTNVEEEEGNNSKELSVTLLSSSSQSQSTSSRQKKHPSQQQEQQQVFSSSSSRNLSRPSGQHHQKQHTRSPKRNKQQLAPSSNTSSESNKANKKFIHSQSSTEQMINQPIRNIIINRKQEPDEQQQQFKEGSLLGRSQPRVPPPSINQQISQQLQNNDDDIDYDDIIEVESDLLDNSFIDDDEDEEEEEEEISNDYGHLETHLKPTNVRRGFRFNEQANTESEYENMSSNINSNSNINNIMRNSSSSHYKSSSSSSSCQKPQSQINNIQLNQNKRATMPITAASELIRPQRAQPANRTHQKSLNSQAHTPYNNEWNLSPRLINTANANLNHLPFDDDTDQDKTVLHINEERKQQLQPNSGLANRGSSVKQKKMIINNFNPSSSSSSNSFLPSQQIRHSHQQPPTADTINSKKMSKKLVAKAYEGSESDEQLESLDQFEKEYVSVKTVSNEANKRHGNHHHQHHHHHSNHYKNKQHLNDQINSKPPLRNNEQPKQYESINRRYSSYELCQQATTDVNLHRKTSNRNSKQIRAEQTKIKNFNELSNSTEISSSMIDLNRKSSTKSTRNANKADLMKQLAEEVESLKQQILKKHLGKIKESGVSDEPKKMRKSQSYQTYQALNDANFEHPRPLYARKHDLNSVKTIRPKDTSIKRIKSNSIRHYTHTNSNCGDTDCEKRPPKLTEKQMLSSISLENLTNQACPKNTRNQNDKIKRRSCIISDETTTSSSTHSRNIKPTELITNQTHSSPPDNHLLCYDSHGRLVTILPSNQLNQLNRNSFPLNEIHQNVIEHQQNVTKPPTPHYNHMQTQTQPNITSKNLIYPAAVTPQVATALTSQQHLTQVMPVHANLPQFYTQTPSNHLLLNNILNSNHNNSTQSQTKRRIRYYIREYGDSSDNEAVHNRDLDTDETILPVQIPVVSCTPVNGYELHDLSEDCSAKKNVNSKNICAEDANKLEKVFKKAFKYAHSLNNTSKKLKKKIFNSINV